MGIYDAELPGYLIHLDLRSLSHMAYKTSEGITVLEGLALIRTAPLGRSSPMFCTQSPEARFPTVRTRETDMAEYILFMHNDVVADDGGAWESYLRTLKRSGVFEGGSEIGEGICVRKAGAPPPITEHLAGYIRVTAATIDQVKWLSVIRTSKRVALQRYASYHGPKKIATKREDLLTRDVALWPTSADLRVARSGSATWGTSDVPLMLSAQPLVIHCGRRDRLRQREAIG
jgi:hypothetical protein